MSGCTGLLRVDCRVVVDCTLIFRFSCMLNTQDFSELVFIWQIFFIIFTFCCLCTFLHPSLSWAFGAATAVGWVHPAMTSVCVCVSLCMYISVFFNAMEVCVCASPLWQSQFLPLLLQWLLSRVDVISMCRDVISVCYVSLLLLIWGASQYSNCRFLISYVEVLCWDAWYVTADLLNAETLRKYAFLKEVRMHSERNEKHPWSPMLLVPVHIGTIYSTDVDLVWTLSHNRCFWG